MHTDHDTLSTFDSDKSSQTSTKLFDRKRGLLICSLNAPSLLKHKSEIEMLLRDNKIDILTLNETKIDEIADDSLISINGYFHKDMIETDIEVVYLFTLKTPSPMKNYKLMTQNYVT